MKKKYLLSIVQEKTSRPVSRPWIRKRTCQMLGALGWKKAALNLWLVSDARIKKLNTRFLRHKRATDVLAFGFGSPDKPPVLGEGIPFLGQLVVSLETADRQARIFGTDFYYEVALYVGHGILHLMGYRDKTSRESKKMDRRQWLLMKQVGMKASKGRRPADKRA